MILLHKVAFDYVTLFDVYECAINPDLLESKIKEAERRLIEADFALLWEEEYLKHPRDLDRFKFRLDKVEARRESTETYHLRDFKLNIDSHDSPHHNYDNRAKRESSPRTNLSQSEHDWAFAKRSLAHGDDPEEVIHQIAQHRARDKSDPQYYARLTVTKARAELQRQNNAEQPGEDQRTPSKAIALDH